MSLQPNILWFTTDQQRFDTIGALGNPHVSTPVLDGLVRSGTAFTHAFCQSPICTPSRASFLTGMYPSTIRSNRNGNAVFSGAAPLVTRLMADAGYSCGNVGKLHLASAHAGPEPRADDGYGFYRYSHAPRVHGGYDYEQWVTGKGASLQELQSSPDGIPSELHQTRWCADMSIEFIEANRERPWLLTVNPFDPHPPFDAPKDYLAMFDPAAMPGPHFRAGDLARQAALSQADFQTKARPPERLAQGSGHVTPAVYRLGGALGLDEDVRLLQASYYAMIKLIDDQLGRILDALAASGQLRRTLVIFTSDHGEMLGDHGLLLKGARFYEGLVRVPLVFSRPGSVAAGVGSDALVELTDIAPTILEHCGIAVPRHMHGRSLQGILEGSRDPGNHRDFVRCEYFDAVDLPHGTAATMYRDRRHKLVVYHDHDLGELYDLEADPWEFNDLWDSPLHRETRLVLTQRSFNAAMAALDKGPDRVAPW
jgi:arylsulfatase A-like enzyme